ncbi:MULTISPECIES: FeoA family protein [Bacillaceae]|jgi:ferrous iron transport protein A|uniref:FeoA family protein n=1 Tax=Bacillaceae TaxID=186817 RepID=UPI00101D3B77|nr:FeoA family protein [Ectobacillus funiculus]
MILTQLERGKQARISDLSHVSFAIQRRLLDLGVDEGTVVSLKGLLPFRGPCIIEVSGQHISLRRKEADCIQVSLEEVS